MDTRNTSSGNAEQIAKTSIPKVIHFIWVGGPIPKEYLMNIKTLVSLVHQHGYEVNLWVDKQSHFEQTSAKEDIAVPSLQIRNVAEIFDLMEKHPYFMEKESVIRLIDKNEVSVLMPRWQLFEEYLGREKTGFKNLASFSDMFRYFLLFINGGYYSDTDAKFTIDKSSGDDNNHNVDSTPKYGFLVGGQWKSGGYYGGNHLLAAVPSCDVLKNILSAILKNYEQLDLNELSGDKTDWATANFNMALKRTPFDVPNKIHGQLPRRYLTINMAAGPGVVMSALNQLVKSEKIKVKDKHDFLMQRVEEDSFSSYLSKSKSQDSVFYASRDYFSFIPQINLVVQTECAQTWLKKNRPRSLSVDEDTMTKSKGLK